MVCQNMAVEQCQDADDALDCYQPGHFADGLTQIEANWKLQNCDVMDTVEFKNRLPHGHTRFLYRRPTKVALS